MSQPKVVSLSTANPKKASVPPILHSVRQHSKKALSEMLQNLFNSVDDALFEMADRSRSDADQSMYFESMRQIRLHRKRIGEDFSKAFNENFETALAEDSAGEEEVEFDEAVDSMSLLQNDELEISVAIAGIASKVTSQHSLPIMQLTKRLDHLCKDVTITERQNPLGPERLSNCFVSALDCVDLHIKVRIILLKLYERFVMERLAPVYAEANHLLAEAGVLPDMKNIMRGARNSKPARSPATDTATRGGPGALSGSPAAGGGSISGAGNTGAGGHSGSGDALNSSFGVIQSLLAASQIGQPAPGQGDGPSMATADLVSVLSAAQSDLDAPIDIEEIPPLLDLHQVVISRAPDVTGEAMARLGQADNDVVNFVSMLFDYILNDRNLAIPMKALIGRLQLPIVKLAVMDKSFFEKSNHPARQLLNELSSAGIGWSSAAELKRDALYDKIESVVLRVMNGFQDNPGIFTELVEELREFINKDHRKRDQVEERVKANESGKAKTHAAKEKVQQLINQKASGMRLPPEIGRFISDTWAKVLVYASIKSGDQSPFWQECVQTLDDLLWCLQPLDTINNVEKRESMLEALLAHLSEGMSAINLTPEQATEHHDRIYSHLHEVSSHDRSYLEDDEVPELDQNYEVMEEIVLTAPDETQDAPDTVPPEPEFLEKINRLRVGVWVELLQDDGERLRCKLATVVEPGPRYVFVNRRGMKVLEKSRMGLAVDLKRKALTILEESQVFDRALQAVIGNLRQMHREPKPVNS